MIYLGSDHGGFELKQTVAEHLKKQNIPFTDCGIHSPESCDYPDIAKPTCNKVKEGDFSILTCGTGIGMSIAANKIKGIRAAVCSDTFSARMSREHNNANVLCIGQRVLGAGLALDIVDAFLNTPLEDDQRHHRRISKLED